MLLIKETLDLIDRALSEDQAANDVTSQALAVKGQKGIARLIANSKGILAGVPVAMAVFTRFDETIETEELFYDGSRVVSGQQFAFVQGELTSILAAERTALNFLQRMSGIATETARYVNAIDGFKAVILDTRKTVPAHRHLDKYAVLMGGGRNHRKNLSDGVLVKDNHLLAGRMLGLGVGDTVSRILKLAPANLKVEVEVESIEEAREALDAGAHMLLLDNMDLEKMSLIVSFCKGRVLTEASGGVDLESVRGIAETGVDFISSGALTHSNRALDISLDLEIHDQ
jgi:nicotinate-nucleotide pyrophosphorylase (carboxylating)